ncbi:ubiquitin carboxyl-terminal hydrolase 14 [Podospora australis]|uniref:ubiquitinyl hydrolase 1 n=1 Tax=Podospora australis TaxID=1536484 RepID=A0AAN6WWS3_9PEZI|nr:ubiquitin carboxyl-terminal hydrolase 14 [Podospora australis]
MEKMKAATLMMPKKFRSVREKNGHRRNRSSEPKEKTQALTAESWLSIFKPGAARQALKEKEEEEKEAAKVTAHTHFEGQTVPYGSLLTSWQVEIISEKLKELNYHEISHELIRYALNSLFAGGDVDKALELLQLQQKAFAGIIQPYNANVEMVGAENRGNVTCYLDALLFAMFAKLTAFECMLKNDQSDEAQRKLAALIRLWVNMLRSGKLIRTDMTQHIQESLAACGWKEAELLEQQDTSEAFAFITETLQLPLLTLQVDLFHQGKRDADDHKVVHERLLNLAVPEDTDGKGIKLEDCLEEYFNNKVDVLRDSLEEKKEKLALTPRTTIRVVSEDEVETPTEHLEDIKLQRRWTVQDTVVQSPVSLTGTSEAETSAARPHTRNRSTSIIQRIVVKSDENAAQTEAPGFLQKAKRTGSTVVKAVTIPAWQFFRLIPWHSTSTSEPSSDAEVARHFNQRPVVGICLKRYTMSNTGVPKRHNTLIDIPDSLRLPHFMMADDVKSEEEMSGLSQEYKLVLQSVVCHRGDSLHSGHYVSFARVAPKLLTDNRRHDNDPPPDYEEAQWAKFDDLAEKRVTYVDDIKESLKEEMPYLLFYQIVPMVDVTTTSTDGSVTEPPSYHESSTMKVPDTPVVEAPPEQGEENSGQRKEYFDSATTLAHSGGPSIRFSAEIDRRVSLDDEPSTTNTKVDNSRRTSVAFSELTAITPAISPEATSPAITPQDESTAARLSRAAAKFKTGSKSRPTSQVGEGRISATISRLGFNRPSKDSLNGGTTNSNGAGSFDVSDEQAVVTEEEDSGKEKKSEEKEKGHHHHHHMGHHNKKDKDRNKSKNREKEKGKASGKDGGVPDRECVVM